MAKFQSTKVIELGSCAFRQPHADSHCKYIHGYRLKAKFWFSGSELDKNNWVVDFGSLKALKAKLQLHFDHTTVLAGDDPFIDKFKELHDAGACNLRVMENGVGIEKFAEFCFKVANTHVKETTNDRCHVDRVEVWEHEDNSATYTNQQVQTTIFQECETSVDVDKFVAAEACDTQPNPQDFKKEEPAPEPAPAPNPEAAPVGNKVSSGISDPFAGTSWSTANGDSLRG